MSDLISFLKENLEIILGATFSLLIIFSIFFHINKNRNEINQKIKNSNNNIIINNNNQNNGVSKENDN